MRIITILTLLFLSVIPLFSAAKNTDGVKTVPSADLLFLGDTSFGENYQLVLKSQGKGNVLEIKGYDYTIAKFKQILSEASLVIGNLETPITDRPYSPLAGKKRYIHFGDVQGTLNTLKNNRFNLLSLANNHAMDYGMPGLTQTIELTQKNGIETCGAGATEKEAAKPYMHTFHVGNKGVNIAILCAYKYVEKYDKDYQHYANDQRGGVYNIDIKKLKAQISTIKKHKENPLVILYLHWGKNYQFTSEYQVKTGRALIDAGADLILGHGAHLMQEIELYNNKWIVYSLGNFVFNSPGRYKKRNAHPFSLIANLRIENTNQGIIKKIRFYPVFSDNQVTQYQSRFVTSLEFQKALDILSRRSRIPGGFSRHISNGNDKYGEYFEIKVE